MPVTLLGIRHHGPGSSRHVLEYLKTHTPDLILIEGPSEAEALFPFLQNPELKPPVALLAYQQDLTKNAVFYPYAVFSPEWQAMKYAQNNSIPFHFFDLPLTHSLGITAKKIKEAEEQEALRLQKIIEGEEGDNKTDASDVNNASNSDESETKDESGPQEGSSKTEQDDKTAANADKSAPESAKDTSSLEKEQATEESLESKEDDEESLPDTFGLDPFDYLAKISGLPDGEAWWECNFEQRLDNTNVFEAVQVAVTELREALPEQTTERDLLREAWMRRQLREAEKTYENIVVVCGAWHVPALAKRPTVKEDNALLKGLPKVKVDITWVPWTYSRLSLYSGYGAGIYSPGWYHHIFHNRNDDGAIWLTMAANVLRKEGKDISVAHVMEALNLAKTLAALRNLSHPSLVEFNEAITTVMGFGDPIILSMVTKKLIVSDRMGKTPSEVPKVPLLIDIEKQQKTLRVPFKNEETRQVLDLRKPLDLNRSIFFYRLKLLGITWGIFEGGSNTNTFRETWLLKYDPHHILQIIDKAIYGTTLQEAVTAFTQENIAKQNKVVELSDLLYNIIPCDLPELVETLTHRIEELSAGTSDILELVETVPTLVKIIRYGTVRHFDVTPIDNMLSSIMGRILAGAISLCINIDVDTARDVESKFSQVNYALRTLANEDYLEIWRKLMTQVQRTLNIHPLLSGASLRILREQQALERTDLEKAISYYTSLANDPSHMAFWLEGFLRDSALVLLHDNELWTLVDNFLRQLKEEQFVEILPILRRTFSNYSETERIKLGYKAKSFLDEEKPLDQSTPVTVSAQELTQEAKNTPVDETYTPQVISVVSMLFGMTSPKP